MALTDESGILLRILENILKAEHADRQDVEYALGSIHGVTEQVELNILKEMQEVGLIKIASHRPSGAVGYTLQQEQDPFFVTTRDALIGPHGSTPSMSLSVNRPAITMISFKREKLEEAVRSHTTNVLSQQGIAKTALAKDASGNFRFIGRPILIGGKPLDRGTKSYKVLDILFEKGNQEGQVTYAVMAKELIKRGETLDVSEEKNRKMVNNALQNTLFRRGKVGEGSFENKLPGGERIIKTYKHQGRFAGWQLVNPPLP